MTPTHQPAYAYIHTCTYIHVCVCVRERVRVRERVCVYRYKNTPDSWLEEERRGYANTNGMLELLARHPALLPACLPSPS